MLDAIRRGQRWLTALFVAGVGFVFVVFIGLGSPLRPGGGDAVIVVGPHRIGIGEFERTRRRREEQIREALGDSFDARTMGPSIEAAAAQLLISRTILALEAEQLGLRVAKQEVEREILSSQVFRGPDGRFDKQAFDNYVYMEFGSERAFREQQRREALANKLLRVLRTQASVSEGEARDALEQRLEAVRIAYVLLDPTLPDPELERDEAAIAAFLSEREAEVRALYDERIEEYDVPEQVRARHVLLRIPDDADEARVAEILERAGAVRQRIVDGEDFASVAREVSEDPGTAPGGGDLGFFRRGQMVPEFDRAAFELAPGTVSEPVRSEYGVHVIRVEERREPELRSFEQVREDLAFELLARSAGRSRAWETAEGLADRVREGVSLETAAREAGLTLERTSWLVRRPDGFVPGLGAAQDLMAVAFTLEPQQSSPRIFEVGDRIAMLQLLEHRPPDAAEVDAQLPAERERLAAQKLDALVGTWIDRRREQLAASGELVVDLESLGS